MPADPTPLDDLLRAAARQTDDPAVRVWLAALLERGERAQGDVGQDRKVAEVANKDGVRS
jgi:hypothetical protein